MEPGLRWGHSFANMVCSGWCTLSYPPGPTQTSSPPNNLGSFPVLLLKHTFSFLINVAPQRSMPFARPSLLLSPVSPFSAIYQSSKFLSATGLEKYYFITIFWLSSLLCLLCHFAFLLNKIPISGIIQPSTVFLIYCLVVDKITLDSSLSLTPSGSHPLYPHCPALGQSLNIFRYINST